MDLCFIHIGKTGGTTMRHILSKSKYNINVIHLSHRINWRKKCFTWIRNPIERYVSTFNFMYKILTCEIPNEPLTLDNCIAPLRIGERKARGYAYSKSLDTLLVSFGTANLLAEALSDPEKKRDAEKVLKMEHFSHDIFYYIGGHIDDLKFVGTCENMTDDIKKLCSIFNIDLEYNNERIRHNKDTDTFLSAKAIENIKQHYIRDYECIFSLFEKNLISKDTYDKYNAGRESVYK